MYNCQRLGGEFSSPFLSEENYTGGYVSFEFLREGRVWLEHDSKFYLLHTSRDVSFSQTFKQDEVRSKTLHTLNNVIEGSSITEANPADFSFTLYLVDEVVKYQHVPLDLLLQAGTDLTQYLQTFNLYFVYSDNDPVVYYKIEKCMFSAGSFNIPRNGIMSVELSGQGRKLTRVEGSTPGSIYAGYDATPTYAISKAFDVYVGDSNPVDKLDNILGVAFEVQNSVSWTQNATVHASLNVTDSTNTIYPNNFTLSKSSLAGSIQQYVANTNALSTNNVSTWKENTTVQVKAGLSSSNYQLELTFNDNASFTNRVGFGDVFTQSYDFRLMENYSSISNIITY